MVVNLKKYVTLVILVIFFSLSLITNAKVFLVSVGVNDYSHFPGGCGNLTLSIKDASAVAKLYGKNTQCESVLLSDSKATKNRIKTAVTQVLGKAQPNDIVVFYFSGHGYPGGFCAYDGCLDYSELRNALSKSRCKNKMMFIDSCHSGGMRGTRRQSNQQSINQAKNANVMLFLSSRDDEISTENRQFGNGTFTAYLLNGLKGRADVNRDRTITARELYNFVHSGVIQNSQNRQHPVMWGKFNDNMPVIKW